MKSVSRRVFLAALAAGSCAAGAAWANGDVFFEAEEIPGQTEYVAFGNVKDTDGKYLDNVIVTIDVAEPHLTYDAATGVTGRYRTLDVGRAVKDLGFDVDPKLVEVTVFKPGYKMAKRIRLSKATQAKGAIEINFVMEKTGVVAKK
jgi:hypothetical protein